MPRAPVRVLVAVEQLRRRVPGGIGTYARGLLKGLNEEAALGRDHGELPAEVSLLASRPPRGAPDPLSAFGRPVVARRLPGPLLTRAWDLGWSAAPGGFDIVHSASPAAPPVRRGARRGATPAVSVTVVHDLAWRELPGATTARGRRWHERALRRALRHHDVLMVPSSEVAGALVDAGASQDGVVVMHEGCDHLPPPDPGAARAVLARLGVGEDYLLAVGTLEPRKNLARLVDAYRLAVGELPGPLPLVIAGARGWSDTGVGGAAPAGGGVTPWRTGLGPDAPSAPARATGAVVALGEVSGEVLAGLYAGARVFAYVPLLEGYGLPPLEAMACGAPVVVSTRVPSVVADDGDSPVVHVDALDVDAIGAALVRVATDEHLRASLTARGAALAATRTWRRTAQEHLSLWDSLR